MRLGDLDALKETFENLASDDYESPLWYESTVFRVIDNAPTVEVPENEVNCVLTMFGKCTYNKTGCSDCEIKDKIRKALSERPQGKCKSCRHRDPEDKKCDCGAQERQGCPFPVSDDYYCKYYEKGGSE